MNVFNRTVVILEILLIVGVLIVAAVVPYTVLERLLYTVQQAQTVLLERWPISYVLFLLVAIVLIFLLILLLWLELRPRPKKTVTVRSVSGTQAEVSTSSVEQSLEYRIGDIGDVLKVKPTVRGKRSGVDIVIDLETTPEIDIPTKMEEVSQAARDVVEGKMGLKVSSIKVRIKQAPYGRAKVSPRPAVSTSMPSQPVTTEQPEQPTAQSQEDTDPYGMS